jgi:hypothetical protein
MPTCAVSGRLCQTEESLSLPPVSPNFVTSTYSGIESSLFTSAMYSGALGSTVTTKDDGSHENAREEPAGKG